MTRFNVVLASAGLALSLGSDVCSAQAQATSKAKVSTRVALVAVGSLPDGKRVKVARRVHVKPQDVILVTPSARSMDLAGALHVLDGMRFVYGDTLARGMEASPENYLPSRQWNNSPYQQWIESQLARLRSARLYRVEGVGTSRAVWITVPAPRGRLGSSSEVRRR